MHRLLTALCLLAVVCGLTACTRLASNDSDLEPALSFEQLATPSAIPAEYGKLVSVTTDDLYPGWAQLWFEQDDGTVVTVFVKYVNGALRQKTLKIPRA